MGNKKWKRAREKTSFFNNYLINNEKTLAMQLVRQRGKTIFSKVNYSNDNIYIGQSKQKMIATKG